MSVRNAILLVAGVLTSTFATRAVGKDHFLTIGGGYSPTGNQVSLEKNVLFLSEILASHRPDNPQHDIYFADGDLDDPDLQYRDPDFKCSQARRIVAELFGDEDVALRYRNHHIPNVRGPTSPDRVRRRLRQLGRELESGDRLFVYATAHGGSSWNEDNPYDTRLYMWDHETMSASEFATWLDQVPREVSVVMVMVQCFAGGFAHAIFHQADHRLGMSGQTRCGFFSQVHDRVAAGCTPDVNEANYQEYSSFFWAALAGRDRLGNPIPHVDYNGDGHTSLDEAHAYAVIESETVDIPIRASDAFLKEYSKIGKKPSNNANVEAPGSFFDLFSGKQANEGDSQPQGAVLLSLSGTLADMLPYASPVDRAIIGQLAAKLELDLDTDVKEIARKVKQAKTEVEAARAKYGSAYSAYDTARDNTLAELRRRWPELEADYSPLLASFTAERADEFVAHVEGMLSYQAMCKGKARADELADEALLQQKHEAKLRRLHHALRRVAWAANLPQVAAADTVERYQQLIALEAGLFVPRDLLPSSGELAQAGDVDKELAAGGSVLSEAIETETTIRAELSRE